MSQRSLVMIVAFLLLLALMASLADDVNKRMDAIEANAQELRMHVYKLELKDPAFADSEAKRLEAKK